MADYISRKEAVDDGYLSDWYIASVGDESPVWTDAHIDELLNDFIVIPKDTKAADVQPVRRGKWEDERYDDLLHCYIATCSECGYESTDKSSITNNHKCCEYCGARMEDLIPIETVLADMESDSGIVAEAAKDYLNIHRDEYRGDRRTENET